MDVTFQMSETDSMQAIADVQAGTPSIAGFVSVTDTSTGQVYTEASPVSVGLIVGIVLGVLAMLALVTVFVVYRIRKARTSDDNTPYVSL